MTLSEEAQALGAITKFRWSGADSKDRMRVVRLKNRLRRPYSTPASSNIPLHRAAMQCLKKQSHRRRLLL
jgi:hypothetical protein